MAANRKSNNLQVVRLDTLGGCDPGVLRRTDHPSNSEKEENVKAVDGPGEEKFTSNDAQGLPLYSRNTIVKLSR